MKTSKIRLRSVLPLMFGVIGDSIFDKRPKNDEGRLMVLPIDQFSGQKFMLNEDGWIMNDIEAFNNAQSDSIARAILQRCPVFKNSDSEDGLSVDERLQEVIPSTFSSPAEFVRVSKHIASVRYNRTQQKIAAREAAVAAKRQQSVKKVDLVDKKE